MKWLNINQIRVDIAVLSNLPVIIALVLLGSAPFLLLLNEQESADQNVGYAFYFLIAAILWKAIQYIMNKNQPENNANREKVKLQS